MYEHFENFPKIGFEIVDTWYRNGNIKLVDFTFSLIGVFVYHCGKNDIKLTKKLTNGCVAEVVVSADKAAVLSCNYCTNKLSGKIHYNVKNNYGILSVQ